MAVNFILYQSIISSYQKMVLHTFTLVISVHFGTCAVFVPKLYGTKTAYADSLTVGERNAVGMAPPDNSTATVKNFYPPYCKPIHLSLIMRHGIRSPSRKDTNNILHVHQRLHDKHGNSYQSDKTPAHMQALLDWKSLFNLEDSKNIVEAGEREMANLAERLKVRYNDLIAPSKDTNELIFLSSQTNRTIGSAQAFISGLDLPRRKPEIKIRNNTIRFFDNCTKYIREVEENPEALKHAKQFKEGPLYQDLRKRLERKLDLELSSAEMMAIYVTMAMEEALMGYSVWSHLVDERDLLILQYAKDIKTYWKKGYGHKISYLQSCPLLADILAQTDEVIMGGKSTERAAFWFGHAETLLPLMCILGLFKDTEPLLADNFDQMQGRQFMTNRILPFSTNVGFLLLECDLQADTQQSESMEIPGWRTLYWPPNPSRYMVQLLVKELPHRFPFCQYDICPYEEMKEHYAHYLGNCEMKKLCSNDKHKHTEL